MRHNKSLSKECDFLRARIWIRGCRAREGRLKPAPGTWQLSWLLMLRGFSDPKSLPCISLSLSLFLSFAEICHIARGPSARQGATMYNPTENKSPRSNTAQLFKARPLSPGAMVRRWGPQRRCGRCDLATPPPPSPHLTPPHPAVLPFNASQPALTFSLFKHCWTLLAPDRGRVGSDNDMPYATLPLQLSEPRIGSAQGTNLFEI